MSRTGFTMRRAVIALAAVVGGAMAGAPPPAAASAGVLVLSGRGASSVDITLPRAATVMPLRLAAENPRGWSWSGCGRVRGFYLQPLRGGAMDGVGAVDLAELRYGRATDVGPNGSDLPRLPVPIGRLLVRDDEQSPSRVTPVPVVAGRYRVHLLGEGACTVRIPMPGLPGTVRRTTTHRTTMQFGVNDLDTPVPTPTAPGVRGVSATFPVRVSRDTFAFSLVHQMGYSYAVGPSGLAAYEMCIEPRPEPPCTPADVSLPGGAPAARSGFYHQTEVAAAPSVTAPPGVPVPAVPLPLLITTSDLANWYAPGVLQPGEQTAKAALLSAPATVVQGAMFALDLRSG